MRAATYVSCQVDQFLTLSPTLSQDLIPGPRISNLIDPHAVHGVETADGSFVYCGKASSESSATASAFAVKISSSGSLLWAFTASTVEALLVTPSWSYPRQRLHSLAGEQWTVSERVSDCAHSADGSEKYRMTTRLVWQARAFEMGSLSTDGSYIFLSGLKNKADLSEMSFKSYGNIPDGTAVVQNFPWRT